MDIPPFSKAVFSGKRVSSIDGWTIKSVRQPFRKTRPKHVRKYLWILARSKRRTQNACSGTRFPNAGGVYSGFWLQKPPNPFFAPCKKHPLCHREFFNNLSKSSWTSVNSTTIKFVRGQNFFLSEKKRIREGNLTCPTNLVRPEPFLLQPKKDLELGRSTFWWLNPPFWAHKSSRNRFLFGGKKVSVSRPRKYINFGLFEQNARSGTRVFKTCAFRPPNRTEGTC